MTLGTEGSVMIRKAMTALIDSKNVSFQRTTEIERSEKIFGISLKT